MRSCPLGVDAEPVAYPWLGHDVRRPRRIALDFATQLTDKDADELALAIVLWTPDGAEQVPVGEDPARVGDERLEEIEFGGRQPDVITTTGDDAPVDVDTQVARLHHCGRATSARRPSERGPYPR